MDGMKLGELVKKLTAALELAGEDAWVSCFPDSSAYGYTNRVLRVQNISVPYNGSPGSVTIGYNGSR